MGKRDVFKGEYGNFSKIHNVRIVFESHDELSEHKGLATQTWEQSTHEIKLKPPTLAPDFSTKDSVWNHVSNGKRTWLDENLLPL